MSNLGAYLVNNFAALYSLRTLQDAVNLNSVTTTEKYTSYLEEAYLGFSLLRYSPKSSQRIKSPKKIYVIDNGFISAKAIQHTPDKGKLMENLVFIEIIKRGIKPNHELFYYKTRNNREIDFVIKQGLQIVELIQVCYETKAPSTPQRAIKALTEASGELKVTTLTILTHDDQANIQQDGLTINIKPLWEWALI